MVSAATGSGDVPGPPAQATVESATTLIAMKARSARDVGWAIVMAL
jgi:hypothetical protein